MKTFKRPSSPDAPGNAGAPQIAGSGSPSETPTAGRSSSSGAFSLARRWTFPAGHPDSILCRQHLRSPVQIPVEISLYRPDGSSYDQGSGVVQDLSYSGLRLGSVILPRGRLLAPCCSIGLRPAFEPPGGPDISVRLLRTFSAGVPAFGIEFTAPDSGAEERLRKST